MKVYKFGGASVKDASAVKNLAGIINQFDDPLVVVVSAMGKTTNALEKVVNAYFKQDVQVHNYLDEVEDYHNSIVAELFPTDHIASQVIHSVFAELKEKLAQAPSQTYNFEYDQVVSFGEILSTSIVNLYLNHYGILSEWVDVREIIKTDSVYREAHVNLEESKKNAVDFFTNRDLNVYVTQGFLGSTANKHTTTLGREGSDYTAALLASFLGAESVTVWKDVEGVLNADPKWFDDTIKLDKLTYTDAIELAFYGASVLHPKTIQPVKKSNIPLYVRSFLNTSAAGTEIGNFDYENLMPSFIFKVDQVLIHIHPSDLSFISEQNLERIFQIFAKYSLKINLMQNTAVSFSICVNNDASRVPSVIDELQRFYEISTEKDLELITIMYYDNKTIKRVLVKKEVLLEQHTDKVAQMVVRKV